MGTWHQVRRISAGAVAAIIASLAENRGIPLGWAVVFGVCAAIITASLLFPLLWKPPKPASDEVGPDAEPAEKPRRRKR